MGISSATAEKLAKLNVNLEITAESNYSPATVENLVKIVAGNNLHITIHAANYPAASIEKFAKLGGANVTVVI
jgi:ABC-type Zn uptake system ZnuABC Zn-binding protein ZnuA